MGDAKDSSIAATSSSAATSSDQQGKVQHKGRFDVEVEQDAPAAEVREARPHLDTLPPQLTLTA